VSFYRKNDIPSHLQKYFVPAEIGLEKSPDAYVAKLVEVFREVRRVLKNDGTVWLNLGDSYAANGVKRNNNCTGKSGLKRNVTDEKSRQRCLAENKVAHGLVGRFRHGLKPKDLIGIPWKVAFALQADGWYLRSEIIWHKLAPMPESVGDRPTKAHEQVFLLAKNQRYYYNADAVREPFADKRMGNPGGYKWKYEAEQKAKGGAKLARNGGVWNADGAVSGRNCRSVWTLGPESFKGAHFAVMPTKLVEPCILAGSRPGDVVLDPFSGAGTVAAVAKANNRRYIGIDLNPEYCRMAEKRVEARNPQLSLTA
jgi:DNA modification methylase